MKMSTEARKNCRTQGKYSDKNLQYEDKKIRKSFEKRLKESPTEKETQEKKFLKRKSDGTKEGTSFSNENNESFLEYQENSEYSFSQLEERKKPNEIKKPGKTVLSTTENGESSVIYEPNFYTEDEARELFKCLFDTTDWLDKSIVIHGVEYPQPRLVAWYGPLPYSYSGTTLEPAEMPECVLAIKQRVEDYLKGKDINVELNSVLLNLYRNNKDSVSWHSDDEFTMGVCPTIASISLGETRKFEMRPKSNRYYEEEHEKKGDEYFVHLNNGSLIIMDGCMQKDWQHRVPKEYHDRNARINLTFRTVYEFKDGSPYSDLRVNNYKPVEWEISKNPSKIKINLDEENFPPLSSLSNNVNSKTSHKAFEKAESCQTIIGINTNKISEKKSEINDHCWESLSKISDRINNSEERWTVETPPSNKTISRINDKINASEEECVVKTPVVTKAVFKTNNAVSTSQGELTPKSLTSHRTFHKRDDVHGFIEEWDDETPNYQKPSTKNYGTNNSIIQINANKIPEKESEIDDHIYESQSKISDQIHNSEEQWAVETPPSNKTTSKINDKICASEEWVVKTSVGTSPENYYSEFGEINKSHNNFYEKSADISQLIPPESDNKSRRDWYDESCNSQILSESDKINQLHEERREKSFDCQQQISMESNKIYRSNEDYSERTHFRQTPLESNKTYKYHENRNMKSSYTRPNWFQSSKTNKYHETKPFNKRNTPLETNKYHRYNERGASEPFYTKNISRQEKNFKSDEIKSFKRSTFPNNKKICEKIEFSNENIDNCEQKFDKSQNSDFKERRNESSNFVVHSNRKPFSNIRSEPGSNRSNEWRPNVKAEEFIPGKKLPSKIGMCPDSSRFSHSTLIDLLNYNVDLAPSDELKNYANALKLRVLNAILTFEPSDKEELEILCEITDGNQTDRNQKIICSRICALVNKTVSHKQWNCRNNPTVSRCHQQANYGNENRKMIEDIKIDNDRRHQDSS